MVLVEEEAAFLGGGCAVGDLEGEAEELDGLPLLGDLLDNFFIQFFHVFVE